MLACSGIDSVEVGVNATMTKSLLAVRLVVAKYLVERSSGTRPLRVMGFFGRSFDQMDESDPMSGPPTCLASTVGLISPGEAGFSIYAEERDFRPAFGFALFTVNSRFLARQLASVLALSGPTELSPSPLRLPPSVLIDQSNRFLSLPSHPFHR